MSYPHVQTILAGNYHPKVHQLSEIYEYVLLLIREAILLKSYSLNLHAI